MSLKSLPLYPAPPSQLCAILPNLHVIACSQGANSGRWREGLSIFGATSLGDPILALEYKQHQANLLLACCCLVWGWEEQVFVSPQEELHRTPLNMFPEDFFPSTSLPLNEIL